jgi:hypothetical protein
MLGPAAHANLSHDAPPIMKSKVANGREDVSIGSQFGLKSYVDAKVLTV